MRLVLFVLLILAMLVSFSAAIGQDGLSWESLDTGPSVHWWVGFALFVASVLTGVDLLCARARYWR